LVSCYQIFPYGSAEGRIEKKNKAYFIYGGREGSILTMDVGIG